MLELTLDSVRFSELPVLDVVDWVGWKRLPLENAISRICYPYFIV